MSQAAREIVVEQVLPHAPETVWTALTSAELIARWLMPNDFAPVVGRRFTFATRPMGDWNGVVQCEVLQVEPPRRLVYSWKGGAGSGMAAPLESVVAWTLEPAEGGTRVRMVHSGFRSPQNDMAFQAMSPGWGRVLGRISEIASEL